MTEDARFEDGAERPLRLRALGSDDVAVMSALLQDAVLTVADISWAPRRRRLSLLVNRFRWEDRAAAERVGRSYERVRSLLVIDQVTAVRSSGVDPRERDMVLSLLALSFEPEADPDGCGGTLRLILAGDGEIAVGLECIEMTLADVTRPSQARARRAPYHDAADPDAD